MKTFISTQPIPMLSGGTVDDRIKILNRAEKEITNRIKQMRFSGEPRTIHKLALVLTLAL